MHTIYKYILDIKDRQIIEMPRGSIIQTVQMGRYDPGLAAEGISQPLFAWVLTDLDEKHMEQHIIYIHGTGHKFYIHGEDDDGYMVLPKKYLGTVQDQGFVWHIYESIQPIREV